MSIKVKMNLDYPQRDPENSMFKKNRDISEMLIAVAVKNRYPKDMNRDASKIFSRIQNKLLDDEDTIDLDEIEFNWLCEQIDRADYPTMLSNWRWMFTDYLEELKKKKEDSPLREVK